MGEIGNRARGISPSTSRNNRRHSTINMAPRGGGFPGQNCPASLKLNLFSSHLFSVAGNRKRE